MVQNFGVKLPFQGAEPLIHETSFIAPGATVIGDVEIGEDTGIWYGCILRGDVNEIKIGARVNIQDGTIIHVSSAGQGTYIGNDVSVGHMALIHACTIEDGAFIGMRATIMDGAVIEKGAMVAAGALVPGGKRVKSGELWMGAPAKYARDISDSDIKLMDWTASHYVQLAKKHLISLRKMDNPPQN